MWISTNNVKDPGSIFSPKPISLVEIFASEDYLDEIQDTEFKRTITIFINEFKEFKEAQKREKDSDGWQRRHGHKADENNKDNPRLETGTQ